MYWSGMACAGVCTSCAVATPATASHTRAATTRAATSILSAFRNIDCSFLIYRIQSRVPPVSFRQTTEDGRELQLRAALGCSR
jgi:hypothetical protein